MTMLDGRTAKELKRDELRKLCVEQYERKRTKELERFQSLTPKEEAFMRGAIALERIALLMEVHLGEQTVNIRDHFTSHGRADND